MTAPLYLARARLRRDAPAAALRPLLAPSDESARVSASHRLVWTLFADVPDRERDFLWREAEPGLFYFLSQRPPTDRHGLFELDEPKLFAPMLAPGDRLAFALRANATVARGSGPGRRGKPSDVVMDALHAVARGERAAARQRVIEPAGLAWLAAQGTRAGFSIAVRAPDTGAHEDDAGEAAGEVELGRAGQGVNGVRVLSYRTLRLDRAGTSGTLGVLDFEGALEVRDPGTFVAAITRGFGRAKAFGCGLMLIRRA
ncbi:MAG: type I-E CRISPR-associated protein Cas6/Cse3/CasE [Gemmatimonadaceae bacterium]